MVPVLSPIRALFGLALIATFNAAAQVPAWDTSGNSLVKGLYYFREVIYVVDQSGTSTPGSLSRAIALYGNMTFDGAGNYTISNASIVDSNASTVQTFTSSGAYSIAASGYGFLAHPLSSSTSAYTLYGLVSNGILIGSATDSKFNDLFIAAPVTSPLPGNSFFRGAYTMAGFLPSGPPSNASDTIFQLNPDGAGNLGTVNIQGYFGGGGTTRYTQTTPSVKYIFSNGAVKISFPNSTTANFYAGDEYLYLSPDATFVFGGSPNGFDMFVGVKNATTTNFGGLYYEAGFDEDASALASAGFALVDTFLGSFNAVGGNIIGHQRVYTPVVTTNAEGFTYSDTYPSGINNATYTTANGTTQYFFGGSDGGVRIGFGVGPALSIQVALRAPTFSGPGVYLNPTGIANAASAAPFTAGVSNGEFIVLYGTNLAPSTTVATALPFPTLLNGVQVTVNGVNASIYYVSSGQIAVIVPFGNTGNIAQIQVTNNGVASNTVTEFVNLTTPGLFTLSANGLGYGAIEHADGTVVTTAHPAAPGETVAMFVAGLGNVLVADPNGLSLTTNTIAVYIGGRVATVAFEGLAPGLAGLYQLNVTIPVAAVAGDNSVEIFGPDSDALQALISVGTATPAVVVGQEQPKSRPGLTMRPGFRRP